MNSPLVSVIIPNYNYGQFLGECISSVLSQTYKNLEIIVVDNFSTDSSRQVVDSLKDSRLRFIEFDNKGAVGRSRNHGARIAAGAFLAFLDSDDAWLPQKLSEQMKAFDDSVGMSFHNFCVQGRYCLKKIRGREITGGVTDLLTRGNPIVTSGVLIRTSLFWKLGGFPEVISYHTAEDLHLWCKVADSGLGIKFVDRVLGKYRVHESASRNLESPIALRSVVAAFGQHLDALAFDRAISIADYSEGVIRANAGQEKAAMRLFLSSLRKKPVFKFRWRGMVRLVLTFCRVLVRGRSGIKDFTD